MTDEQQNIYAASRYIKDQIYNNTKLDDIVTNTKNEYPNCVFSDDTLTSDNHVYLLSKYDESSRSYINIYYKQGDENES